MIHRSWGLAARVTLILAALASPAQADAGGSDRFLARDDQVLDRRTGLTWQRCSHGQRWEAQLGCVGVARKVWFAEARALEGGGWRLPTLAELGTLYPPGPAAIADPVAFPDAPDAWYWALGPGHAPAVSGPSCGGPRQDTCARGEDRAVRLVRRGPLGGAGWK